MFCWLDHVEEDDCVLAEVYLEKKVLAPESWSQNHDASFENCWEYNVHGSFGNQPDYGPEGLLPELFSQDGETIDLSGHYNVIYGCAPIIWTYFLTRRIAKK